MTFSSADAEMKEDPASSEDLSAIESPLVHDRYLFEHGHRDIPPYNPHLDRLPSDLFRTRMPGTHSRETVVHAEGFWGKFIRIHEGDQLKRYWRSYAASNSAYREQIREMVAVLGSLVFDINIYVG